MNPLAITITFLMLIAILVSSDVKRFINERIGSQLYNNYFEAKFAAEEERELATLNEIKASAPSQPKPRERRAREPSNRRRRVPSLKINEACPPNNSRLNFHYLMVEPKPLREKRTLSFYAIASRLLKKLYGTHPLFLTQRDMEKVLLDALIAKKEETTEFKYPDELASLTFTDPTVSKLFSFMWVGGFDENGKRYPSLLNFITFDRGRNKRINLMFASSELLEALFDHQEIMRRFLAARTSLLDYLFKQEEERRELSVEESIGRDEIRKAVFSTIQEIVESEKVDFKPFEIFIDCSLSKQGNLLLMTDPKTGIEIREKL